MHGVQCEKGCPLCLFLSAWHSFMELGIIIGMGA
jgi:hypothetical protein